MKTVKTLHFDFIYFGVSLSVSFGYHYNQPTRVGRFCIYALACERARVHTKHSVLSEGSFGYPCATFALAYPQESATYLHRKLIGT